MTAEGAVHPGREAVAAARRVVVKVGSSALARDPGAHRRLAAEIRALHAQRRSVTLVSSGAIALGWKKLGYRERPKEMAKLQASAAAGQSLLMRAYEEAFEAEGLRAAQVLLTHADLADRTRSNNARRALAELLDARCVPILNENDSVSVEEIKFGDNDQLAALVAPLVDADLLVLLSDVPGLLDHAGALVPTVDDVARDALPLVRASKSDAGTGGMASKLEAARRATLAGAHVVIADATSEAPVSAIVAGELRGTHFRAAVRKLPARKHWIAFTLRPRGDVLVDAGAEAALRAGRSLLAVGVRGVRGDFRVGDAVRVLGEGGVEVGRGLASLSVAEAALTAGRAPAGDDEGGTVVIHRDDLVPLS